MLVKQDKKAWLRTIAYVKKANLSLNPLLKENRQTLT